MSSPLPQTSPTLVGAETRTLYNPVFDKAVAKFKKRLTKSQAESFTKCTIDDVKSQIRDIQNHHGSQRRLRNMDRLSKFVEGMTQLGKVVDTFLNLHNTVALIWGPVKFLLLTASTWIDSLDSLLDVYGRIGEVLPDLTRCAQIYEEYPSVHTHLEAYFCDILEFHSNALEVFARSGWKTLFHSAWKTFNAQFGPIFKNLERHRVMLSEEKLTAVMEATQKQAHSVQARLDQLDREWLESNQKNAERDLIAHQNQIDQQYGTVQSRIDAPDYHEDYEIASQKRFESTSGHWILSHPVLSEWLDLSSKGNGKIYLSGIPGAGKTVLTSSLISHLKERQLSCKDTAERFSLSYFYFKHHQPRKCSLVSLLLALLAQLVAQDESLLDHVYQSCRSAEPHQFRSFDEVSRQVSVALQSHSRCFVIIDGLDECPEASKVLMWFESAMTNQDDTSTNTDFNFRLFISGQRDGVLENQMSGYTKISLETASGHDRDIATFATTMASRIREKFSLDFEVEQDIISRVTSQAGGMFLYAQLVLSNLFSQTSKYYLKQEMETETFPEGLEQAYERVIVRVLRNPNKAERVVAKQILGMVMCACRPLHWREIQSRFCIDPSKGEADIDRKHVISCKEICGSLVDISYIDPSVSTPGEEIINLVHTTAEIYLVQTKEIDLSTENAEMALFCVDYMLSRPLTSGIPTLEIQEHASKGYYGFHDYAAAFWWKHTKRVVAAPELNTELARRVLHTAHRVVIDTGELEDLPTFDDSPKIIQSLKNKLGGISKDLREWDSIKIYEMRTVAVRKAIELLLNRLHEPKQNTIPLYGSWRYKCHKPWCQYFSRGFQEKQQQQIHINQHELPFTCEHQGCHATEFGFETKTELKNHIRKWHPNKEPLLFPVAKRRTSSHPDILKAAQGGDLDTIRDLIEQGNVSPDYQKKGGKSLLEAAVQNGHLHVVQYLTQMGANINVRLWHSHGTMGLLHFAVEVLDLDMVTFLCGLDSISLADDLFSNTPLDIAVTILPLQKAIIAQLIRKATVKDLRAALGVAIRSEKVMAVAYFAETINVSCFDSALQHAAKIGYLPCLDALLSSGKVDPNARDSKGDLPYHAACKSGQLRVVQRLHTLTTTTDITDASGNTPLHLASVGGHDAVVEFLLDQGADINAKNRGSATPLQLAQTNRHETVRQLLLDNGARSELVSPSPDPHQMMGMDNPFGPLFDGDGMEMANPLHSGGVLDDFDFESFLQDQDRDSDVVNFHEAFPMGDKIAKGEI